MYLDMLWTILGPKLSIVAPELGLLGFAFGYYC
jgi:hypothetical protein